MRAQELYNSYCKKEITETDFLYHIRRDELLKEVISPVNNTQDVITILKNKGMITQQVTEDQLIKEAPGEDEHGEAFPNDPEYGEELDEEKKINQPDYKYYTCQIFQDGSLNICEGFEEENDAKDNKKELESYLEDDFIMKVLSKRFLNSKGVNPDDNKYWKDPQDDSTKGGTAKLTVKKEGDEDGEDDYIHEVKKPKLNADQVNYYEFTRGWRLELETTDDIDKAKDKALKNLATDPAFYTNLIAKQTADKQKVDPKNNKEKILKAPTDQVELKDRENQMKNAKKKDPVKSNVKDNLGKKEKAKGQPKGVKVMKLKEGIKNIIKENDAYNQHIEAIRGMVKMDPEELAKQVLGGQLPMSGLRAEFAAKVLGKLVADGNKSPEVAKAFQQLSDKHLNEGSSDLLTFDEIKQTADKLIKARGSKQSAIKACDDAIEILKKDPNAKSFKDKSIEKFTKTKEYLSGNRDLSLKGDKDTFSTNESTDFESWKKSVIGDLQTSVKSDEKVAEKIFSHYMKDFQSSHSSGKDPKTAVKDFLKNVKKPKKEEFEGNVGPQEADWIDTELEENKVKDSKKDLNESDNNLNKLKSDINDIRNMNEKLKLYISKSK